MAQNQRLDIKQGQSLVMTPQLQQAIKLLQLSNAELAEFVEEEIERNPLLTRDDSDQPLSDQSDGDKELGSREELALDGSKGLGEGDAALDAPSEDAYEADSPSDSIASGPSATTDWSGATDGKQYGEAMDFEASLSADITLNAHLHEQLALATLSGADKLIAARLIDETDEAGYCRADLDDVANVLGTEPETVLSILKVCQGFDPIGVMARSIPECMALQLKERNRLDPAMQALLDNLDLVAKHDLKGLIQACGVDKDDITDMISELKTLTPRPGSGFASGTTIAVSPDVFVRELPNGMYSVELNNETLPRVLMDKAYYAEVSALPMREKEKEFISECAANASWLIKALDQRARTILKVASEIVRQQDAFFAYGVAHLRPLNLKQVADAINMHESTVSRVTSKSQAHKFMSTPRGMFEMKYFFSPAIPSTGAGEAHSAEAVRHRIKALIDEETPGNVLSDDQIVEILTEFGVDIARRTVAKYRESLNIPSSVQRRRVLKQSA